MDLNNFLPYRLSILSLKISKGIAKHYEEQFGINIAQWRILVILNQYQNLTAKTIGHYSQMDKVRISRTVQSLLKINLISQRVDKQDARARNYVLTDLGKNLIDQVIPAAVAYEASLYKVLDKDEKNQLNKIIDKMNQFLQ